MSHRADIDGQNWQALADAVVQRRHQMDISQEEVTQREGPSHQTLREIERGHRTNFSERTLTRLQGSLGWHKGLVQSILAGSADEGDIFPGENLSRGSVRPDPPCPDLDEVVITRELFEKLMNAAGIPWPDGLIEYRRKESR